MGKIVIAADLGHFKAYRIIKDPLEQESPRIELIEAYDTIEGKERDGERFTDAPGAFRRKGGGGQTSAGGFGERHGIGNERQRRLLKLAAENISRLLRNEGMPKWDLCACKSINKSLLECLDKKILDRLGTSVKVDLAKANKEDILSRFGN